MLRIARLLFLAALVLDASWGLSAPIVGVSWSPDSAVSTIDLWAPYQAIYVKITEPPSTDSIAWSLEWCALPNDSGRVHLSPTGLPERPTGWVRPSPAGEIGFEDVLQRGYAETDLEEFAPFMPLVTDTFRLQIPLFITEFGGGPSLWFRLTGFTFFGPDTTVTVSCPSTWLSINPGSASAPASIDLVDPPRFVANDTSAARVFLVGSGLGQLNAIRLMSTDYRVVVGDSLTVLDSTLVRGSIVLTDSMIGRGICLLSDTSGRKIESTMDVDVWDGVFTVLGEEGDTLAGVTEIAVENAVPGEVLIFTRRKALDYPDSLAEDSLLVADAQTLTLPALFDALERMGATSIERVFKRFDDDDLWTAPLNADQYRKPDLRNVFKVHVPGGGGLEEQVLALRNHGDILWAESDQLCYVDGALSPDDSAYCEEQWTLCPDLGGEHVNVEEAWETQVGNEGVRVGFIDTGIDYSHPDLGDAFGSEGDHVRDGWDYFDNDGDPMDEWVVPHGTHVAGIAGALTNNEIGIAGVAGGWEGAGSQGPELFAFKVFGATTLAPKSAVAAAFREAADNPNDGYGYGVNVINASLGCSTATCYSEVERAGIVSAYVDRATIVCAKGNTGNFTVNYPSDYDKSWIISVGGTTFNGSRYSSSSKGHNIDLAAPGLFVYSLLRADSLPPYGDMSGTSMAAPHVSGAAALLISEWYSPYDQFLAPEDLGGLVTFSAADKGTTGYDALFGNGILDVGAAFEFMKQPWAVTHVHDWDCTVSSSLEYTGTYYFFGDGSLADGPYSIKRYKVRGSVDWPEEFVDPPYVWGRGSPETIGWSAANPNYQVGYCRLLPGTVTTTGCDLETYVYEVWTILGQPLGWYPCAPNDVDWYFTALGIPVSAVDVDGPGEGGVPQVSHPYLKVEPNPFNPRTTIRFGMPGREAVRLSVYDVRGRLVTVLSDRAEEGFAHLVTWDGTDSGGNDVASGVYFFELAGKERRLVEKGVLIR